MIVRATVLLALLLAACDAAQVVCVHCTAPGQMPLVLPPLAQDDGTFSCPAPSGCPADDEGRAAADPSLADYRFAPACDAAKDVVCLCADSNGAQVVGRCGSDGATGARLVCDVDGCRAGR